jgi:hypothetical protein
MTAWAPAANAVRAPAWIMGFFHQGLLPPAGIVFRRLSDGGGL